MEVIMEVSELTNHRVSYQVIVTFDLKEAQSSDYTKLCDELEKSLYLEKFIYLSKEDGGTNRHLPLNTLATLYEKAGSVEDTRLHFEKTNTGGIQEIKLSW